MSSIIRLTLGRDSPRLVVFRARGIARTHVVCETHVVNGAYVYYDHEAERRPIAAVSVSLQSNELRAEKCFQRSLEASHPCGGVEHVHVQPVAISLPVPERQGGRPRSDVDGKASVHSELKSSISEALPSGSTQRTAREDHSKKVISYAEGLRPYCPAHVQRSSSAARRWCTQVEVIKA